MRQKWCEIERVLCAEQLSRFSNRGGGEKKGEKVSLTRQNASSPQSKLDKVAVSVDGSFFFFWQCWRVYKKEPWHE